MKIQLATSDLTNAIIEQNDEHIQNKDILKENKNKIKTSRENRHKEKSGINTGTVKRQFTTFIRYCSRKRSLKLVNSSPNCRARFYSE